jgi:hypothetical protein
LRSRGGVEDAMRELSEVGGDDARMKDVRHGLDAEKQELAVHEGGVD